MEQEQSNGDAPQPESSEEQTQRDLLKRAMKAFRKRLKLTKLNDESKLGRNPLTSGRASKVVAIMPPNQYEREVWSELVSQGKLRDAGQGFYELIE